MGQIIITGRNGNYPTTESLPELSDIPDVSAPYPELMMRTLSGHNKGYPCVALLPELSAIPDVPAPYPELMMRALSGHNKGYPCAALLPELYDIPDICPPYPELMMRCLGSEINDGYPCVASVEGVEREIFSSLCFGDRPVTAMYYNEKFVASAYCGGEKVYGVKYVKK